MASPEQRKVGSNIFRRSFIAHLFMKNKVVDSAELCLSRLFSSKNKVTDSNAVPMDKRGLRFSKAASCCIPLTGLCSALKRCYTTAEGLCWLDTILQANKYSLLPVSAEGESLIEWRSHLLCPVLLRSNRD
jgi:hypothetical protein